MAVCLHTLRTVASFIQQPNGQDSEAGFLSQYAGSGESAPSIAELHEQIAAFSAVESTTRVTHINVITKSSEYASRSRLIIDTLNVVAIIRDDVFREQLPELFPLLTDLIGCEFAPLEV